MRHSKETLSSCPDPSKQDPYYTARFFSRRGLLGAAFAFLLISFFSLLALSPAQAQGYPSGGSYPGSGAWYAVHCDSQGKDIPNDPPSAPYPLKGTQTVTNTNTYPQKPIDPSYPQGSYTLQNMVASEGSRPGQMEYGIGFDGHFDSVSAPNCETDSYGHWVGTLPYTDSSGRTVIAGPWNGQVQRDANGQILAYFQWRFLNTSSHIPMPPPAGSLPPDHMDILLKTQLTAYTYVVNGSYSEAWATDGAPFQETAGPGLPINGLHFVRATTGADNIMETYLNGQVHMLTKNQIPFNPKGASYATAWAFVSASAAQESNNREVYITCPTIETSFYKYTGTAQNGISNRWAHQRDPLTGAIQTDSAAVYSTADNKHGWNAGATFIANTPGFTNPSYSWSSDFNPVAMLGVSTHYSTIAGSWYFGSIGNLPHSSTVTLNVQDGDKATASNTFGIKWHLPFEAPNPVPYLVYAGKYSVQPARVGPVSDGQTTLLSPTQPHHFDWDAAIDGASVVAKVAGQEDIAGGLEIVGAITQIAKPDTDVDGEPKQENGATNGPATWGDAQSENQGIYTGGNVPANLMSDPNGWQLCKMWIFQVVDYKDKCRVPVHPIQKSRWIAFTLRRKHEQKYVLRIVGFLVCNSTLGLLSNRFDCGPDYSEP